MFSMLRNELKNIIARTKKKGVREGLRYIRGHVHSVSKYYVLRHDMDKIPDLSQRFENFKIVEICDPDSNLLEEMYHVWPSETRPGDISNAKELMRERTSKDVMCFALLDNDRLVGATWISRPNNYYLNLNIPYLSGEYVSYWTFIVPDYQGRGMSKFLKIYSLLIARQKGIFSIISLSSIKNTPAIKMNLSVGYKIIGTFTKQNHWFKSNQYFTASNETH